MNKKQIAICTTLIIAIFGVYVAFATYGLLIVLGILSFLAILIQTLATYFIVEFFISLILKTEVKLFIKNFSILILSMPGVFYNTTVVPVVIPTCNIFYFPAKIILGELTYTNSIEIFIYVTEFNPFAIFHTLSWLLSVYLILTMKNRIKKLDEENIQYA